MYSKVILMRKSTDRKIFPKPRVTKKRKKNMAGKMIFHFLSEIMCFISPKLSVFFGNRQQSNTGGVMHGPKFNAHIYLKQKKNIVA